MRPGWSDNRWTVETHSCSHLELKMHPQGPLGIEFHALCPLEEGWHANLLCLSLTAFSFEQKCPASPITRTCMHCFICFIHMVWWENLNERGTRQRTKSENQLVLSLLFQHHLYPPARQQRARSAWFPNNLMMITYFPAKVMTQSIRGVFHCCLEYIWVHSTNG